MSLLVTGRAGVGTPAASKSKWFFDSTGKIWCAKDDAGRYTGQSNNASIAAQGPGFAADTYLTDSAILIPSFSMQARSMFRWIISASKTAAGIVAPAWSIRIGAAKSTADTQRLLLTGPAQTAAADVAVFALYLLTRSVGAAGVIQGTISCNHNGAAAGFTNNDGGVVEGTSAGFDNQGSAIAGLFMGLSVNGGASAAWTVTQVRAEAIW